MCCHRSAESRTHTPFFDLAPDGSSSPFFAFVITAALSPWPAQSVQAYRHSSSPPLLTKVVPRIGILPPMVAALPIATFERLKPHAIDIRVNIDPVHWFLSPAKDTRSSLYLEDAATEFQVQGLELDWTIVTWDADLRWSGDDWSYHNFRGAKWTDVKKPDRQRI
jgi:hypothetical protein